MRLETLVPGYVEVVLSKKNLLSLLHKVDTDWSACTVVKLEQKHSGMESGLPPFTEVVVRVEPDELHYAHESRGEFTFPGTMHPETEAFVDSYQRLCYATDPTGRCCLDFGHDGDCSMVKS